MNTIVYIMDEGYAVPTCTSVCSILDSSKDEDDHYRIIIFCKDISERTKNVFQTINIGKNELILEDIPRSVIIEADRIAKENSCRKGISANSTALIKFWLPELLKEYKKVLYLDGDTLVCHSLSDLFYIDISDVYLAASMDMPGKDQDEEKKYQKDVLGVRDYFNSGMMLLNLEQMRLDNIVDSLISFRSNQENHLMDQDAFNAVIGKNKRIVSSLYNMMISYVFPYSMQEMECYFGLKGYKSLEALIDNAFILHMVCKPWSIFHPIYCSIFDRYFLKTPFAKERLIRRTLVPYDKFGKTDRIIIYGAGSIGRFTEESMVETRYGKVVLWVDKNAKEICDSRVESVEAIKLVKYDYVIVAVLNKTVREDIISYLMLHLGVNRKKILEYGSSSTE